LYDPFIGIVRGTIFHVFIRYADETFDLTQPRQFVEDENHVGAEAIVNSDFDSELPRS
jgi:hypothetical protein